MTGQSPGLIPSGVFGKRNGLEACGPLTHTMLRESGKYFSERLETHPTGHGEKATALRLRIVRISY